MPAHFLAWASARLRCGLTVVLLALPAFAAWAATPADEAYRFTAADRAFLATLTLDRLPPPPPSPSNAQADDPRAAQLGQRLFFDPALSDSGRFACATCHQPARHFSDGLPRAVAAGTARRHTPSLLGAAHGPWLNWDGSADSLWAQALGPIEHADEMATPRSRWVGRVLQAHGPALTAVFGPVPGLPSAAVLATPMSPLGDAAAQAAWQALSPAQRSAIDRVFAQTGKALAAYQRRLQMAPARFDRFVQALQRGDDAAARQQMAPDEVAGLRLFVGAARCVSCHNGPLFTNHEFHNIGAPEPDRSRVDLGRAEGVQRLQGSAFTCLSSHSDANAERDCGEMRFLKSQGPELVGAFKTPSLRNVAATAPYMQAGQLATLADVLAHYNQPPPPFYDPAQHPSRPHFDILPLQLTPAQLGQLAAFLGTLTSPLPADDPLVAGAATGHRASDTTMTAFSDAADTWNRRFTGAGNDFLFGREPNAWLRRHAAWPAGARVLCVADGEGRNSVWLAQQGLQVDAFDIAEAGVRKARALAAEAGVTVHYDVADVDGWAWPEAAYDGVAAIFVQFADPALRSRLFARMQRCLKPGGLLLLQGYTPRQLDYRTGGPGQLDHLYTEALLREAFADMEIVTLEDYEDDLAEGSGHHGRSALIGLVARRR